MKCKVKIPGQMIKKIGNSSKIPIFAHKNIAYIYNTL